MSIFSPTPAVGVHRRTVFQNCCQKSELVDHKVFYRMRKQVMKRCWFYPALVALQLLKLYETFKSVGW